MEFIMEDVMEDHVSPAIEGTQGGPPPGLPPVPARTAPPLSEDRGDRVCPPVPQRSPARAIITPEPSPEIQVG